MIFTNVLRTITIIENAFGVVRNLDYTKHNILRILYAIMMIAAMAILDVLYDFDIEEIAETAIEKYSDEHLFVSIAHSVMIIVWALLTSKQFERLTVSFHKVHLRLLPIFGEEYNANILALNKCAISYFVTCFLLLLLSLSVVHYVNYSLLPMYVPMSLYILSGVILTCDLRSGFEFIAFNSILSMLSVQLEFMKRALQEISFEEAEASPRREEVLLKRLFALTECVEYTGDCSLLINSVFSLPVCMFRVCRTLDSLIRNLINH